MTFSICIPNFNYAKFLGKTLDSVLKNSDDDFEILISDNASTDDSISVVSAYQEKFPGIRYRINETNLGFAANLDRVADMAKGKYIIMLSSDDLMKSDALEVYKRVHEVFPDAMISSSMNVIDSDGRLTGYVGPNKQIIRISDRDEQLSELIGCDVYRFKAGDFLRRCFERMGNPLNFCSVCYPTVKHRKVGGYTSRLINPDKWFHWKVIAELDDIIYVDKPLFEYRWHSQNQSAIQASTGQLKYLFDEYRNTIEITDVMLRKAGYTRDQFFESFIKNDIHRHGIGEYLKGRWTKSMRVFLFGLSTYPSKMMSSVTFLAYVILLLTTPFGSFVISWVLNLEKRR